MRQSTAITAEVMFGPPRLFEAEPFNFDTLVVHLLVKVRQCPFDIGHISRKNVNTKFHGVLISFGLGLRRSHQLIGLVTASDCLALSIAPSCHSRASP